MIIEVNSYTGIDLLVTDIFWLHINILFGNLNCINVPTFISYCFKSQYYFIIRITVQSNLGST